MTSKDSTVVALNEATPTPRRRRRWPRVLLAIVALLLLLAGHHAWVDWVEWDRSLPAARARGEGVVEQMRVVFRSYPLGIEEAVLRSNRDDLQAVVLNTGPLGGNPTLDGVWVNLGSAVALVYYGGTDVESTASLGGYPDTGEPCVRVDIYLPGTQGNGKMVYLTDTDASVRPMHPDPDGLIPPDGELESAARMATDEVLDAVSAHWWSWQDDSDRGTMRPTTRLFPGGPGDYDY